MLVRRGLFDGIYILVVENDHSVAMVLKEMLEAQYAIVEIAESGKQAIKCCCSQYYQVVFTDLKMPEMSGLEVSKHIRQLSPRSLIFLVTGVVQGIFEAELADSGIYQVIHKPFRMRDIYSAIKKALEETDADSA